MELTAMKMKSDCMCHAQQAFNKCTLKALILVQVMQRLQNKQTAGMVFLEGGC